MWSLGVVAVSKPIEAPLLRSEGASRRARGLGLERPVHPLVSPVLLGMRGLDELRMNAEADPPHGEGREAAQGTRGKRRAVIGADPLREAIALEEPEKHGPTRDDGRLEQAAAAEQETRRGVLDRKRVAVDAIAGAKLPFEIGGPDRIRLIERGVGTAVVKAAPRSAPAAGAAMPLENPVHRGHRGDELARHAFGEEQRTLRAPQRNRRWSARMCWTMGAGVAWGQV